VLFFFFTNAFQNNYYCTEQDVGGIPSQFPVQEDTQFLQILRESLDFFGIEEVKQKEFFLVDFKTRNFTVQFIG
jgi:Protein UNC80